MKMTNLTDDLKRKLSLPLSTQGSIVVSIIDNGPAEKAGLLPGDIVQGINNEKVESVKDVQRVVRLHQAGEVLTFDALRKGVIIHAPVTLTPMPDEID
jgi:serine protease Do